MSTDSHSSKIYPTHPKKISTHPHPPTKHVPIPPTQHIPLHTHKNVHPPPPKKLLVLVDSLYP